MLGRAWVGAWVCAWHLVVGKLGHAWDGAWVGGGGGGDVVRLDFGVVKEMQIIHQN